MTTLDIVQQRLHNQHLLGAPFTRPEEVVQWFGAVQAIELNRRIVIEWPGYSGLTSVEWLFTPHTDNTTFVSITETGFSGDGDALVQQVTASTQGFTLVLAGLKALLEHNIRLNLVADRYPKGLEDH